MTIKIIGARASNPINSPIIKKFTCGEIYSDQVTIRIDAGVKAVRKPDLQLISHLHKDHFGKVQTLPKGTKVWAPDTEFVKKLSKHKHIQVKKIKTHQPFNFKNFKITPFKVLHSRHTPAYGYRIEAEGRKIAWLSDFRRLKGVLKFFKDLDALFIGASSFKRDITHRDHQRYGHMSAINTLKTLRRNKIKPKKIFLIHIGRSMTPVAEKVDYLRRHFPYFKIDFCWDGRVIKI